MKPESLLQTAGRPRAHAGRQAALACALVAGLLAGCVPDLRSEHPPERVYWLEPVRVANPPPMVVRLSVVPGLQTDRVQVLQPDGRLNHYAGAFWTGSLAPVLESVLGRSLNAGRDGPVVEVLVERFFAREAAAGGPPEIEVAARVTIADRGGRGFRCAVAFRSTAASGRLRDIVAGHQERIGDLARAVAWMVTHEACP